MSDFWPAFVYFHSSCVRTAKALASAGSPEPSLVAYVISTIISSAGSDLLKFTIYTAPKLSRSADTKKKTRYIIENGNKGLFI